MKRPGQLLTRRGTLRLGLAGLTGMVPIVADSHYSQHQQTSNQIQIHLSKPQRYSDSAMDSLKKRAESKGLIYGAAAEAYRLSTDNKFAANFIQECSILAPEGGLKWIPLRPAPNQFNFTFGDWLAEFAHLNNVLFRGHTLVWDQALPDWFKETINYKNAERFLVEHITTVVKHYAGKIHSWDVVNEGVAVGYSNRSDNLSLSPWMRFIGKGYIDIAFRAAAEADPQALLVYNDCWLDYDTSRDNAQRVAVLNLLEYLKSIGTPIHALGIQAHLRGRETRFNPKKFRQFLSDVASLGLKIMITELDVADAGLPADIDLRDRIVAHAYEEYLSVALDEPAVIAVLTWGLSDRSSWLSEAVPRSDKLPVRPLPLDANFKRKLAWNAIARAFDNAPVRSKPRLR
jgi:endo-1,4-beta-xylanase